MELIDQTTTEIIRALTKGLTTSTELAERWIARTEASKALNCYVAFDAAGLLKQAAQADARRSAGAQLPLLGVPIALKDNIDAVGFPCGNGTASLHGNHPKTDAALVQRLRAAGALIPGKLGLHELAFGATSNNTVTGPVRNPWNPNCIPGGSSGGSGAAVGARLVPAAIGTDTGGSVRVPAALCGVAGLRPTVGRVNADGIAPISATRDTAGPIARSIADLALLDSVLTGDLRPVANVSLQGLRLGLPQAHFWEDLDPGVRAAAEASVDSLRSAGAVLVPIDLPGIVQLNGEVSFVVALYEFVRDMTRYLDLKERGITFDELIAGIGSADVMAIAGPLLQSGAVSEAAYQQALLSRERLRALYADAFAAAQVAALVFPTTPCTAARIGQDETFELNGRACPTFATFIRNCDPGSNAALPGLTLPVGLHQGLPVGLSLDGPSGSDRELLAIGAAIEATLAPMPLAPAAG